MSSWWSASFHHDPRLELKRNLPIQMKRKSKSLNNYYFQQKNSDKVRKNQHQGVLYGLWVQLLRDRLLSNGNHATSHTANVNCLLSVSVFLEFQTFGMNLNWYNQSSHIIWAQITVIILVIRYYENVRFAQNDPFLPIFLKFSLHFPKCFQKLLHRISPYFE